MKPRRAIYRLGIEYASDGEVTLRIWRWSWSWFRKSKVETL